MEEKRRKTSMIEVVAHRRCGWDPHADAPNSCHQQKAIFAPASDRLIRDVLA